MEILNKIKFDSHGLIAVIAQSAETGEVLMQAWANKEAITKTLETGKMHYFSRSRDKLWMKGESSGQIQIVKELLLDCDLDSLLAKIEQTGVACHTGRKTCFFNLIDSDKITINQKAVTSPDELYK
jgi:phosphoribosyl-AMP cyclohydrolase